MRTSLSICRRKFSYGPEEEALIAATNAMLDL
jgi:hypothetical protein